ncbi:Adenylyl-sulfate kinase [Frondihabitans sp. 762G35]|uniref:adenylyl-sulfate kinase n=1 Tax=Frondihabitans sp. 762G35 TaxID=1446794 RepID=UPI000D227F21|nr:adenylyl-sulfate kinase [Frondihabitans sp. 762G35]ARC56956.1 Adenylyl-sulfate kinase [Frondihabitans sp. 762G35]
MAAPALSEPGPAVALVVIAGPQASGKSTIATALSHDLRERGERVALVDLDGIAAMALPTLPDWETAHAIFESVTGRWLRSDLTCVIAEGSGSHEEVARLVALAPSAAVVVTVAITAPFQIAFERARQDPARGVSRQRDFLADVYRRWPGELARLDPDVVLDTGRLTVKQSVDAVRMHVADARGRRTP